MADRQAFDCAWVNARIATLQDGPDGLCLIEDGAIAARTGRIAYVGPRSDLPGRWRVCARLVNPLESIG